MSQDKIFQSKQTCARCGKPLAFRKRPGRGGVLKWWPCNPDGSDHFDDCKKAQRQELGVIRHDGSVDFARIEQMSPARFTGQHNVIPQSDKLPWED